jgi:hypothetical protein
MFAMMQSLGMQTFPKRTNAASCEMVVDPLSRPTPSPNGELRNVRI